MGPGAQTRPTYRAHDFGRGDHVTDGHSYRREMGIERVEPAGMTDLDERALATTDPGEDDHPRGGL